MNNPILRYLVSLFCPPLIGSLLLLAYNLVEDPNWEELLLYSFILPFYGFIFCFLPGNFYFALQEAVLKYSKSNSSKRSIYLGSGAALGLLSGLFISLFAGDRTMVTFISIGLIGLIAGLVTAWITFPKAPPQEI